LEQLSLQRKKTELFDCKLESNERYGRGSACFQLKILVALLVRIDWMLDILLILRYVWEFILS
jgi:hypothetical protein